MKISILCSFLSSNALGRAYVLAKLLQQRYEVEIVGPVSQNGIWMPLSREAIDTRAVEIKPRFGSIKFLRTIDQIIDGQILYASKPLLTSFGIGLQLRLKRKLPLVLDIDDWEIGNFTSLSYSWKLRHLLHPNFQRLDSYYPLNRFFFSLCHLSDSITVSSRFLQNKYGGMIIPHARDTTVFDPALYNPQNIKGELNLTNKQVILFMGTPRSHKGLEELAQAIHLINRQDIVLVVAGIQKSNQLVPVLQNIVNESLVLLPMQPFNEIPKILAMADIVAIPQKSDAFAQAQVPAKIIDAMAMGKPIIASAVSDIPEILNEGCGLLVKPGDILQLAERIEWVLDHKLESTEMGLKARKKCQMKYSYQVVSPLLCDLFEQFIQ